MSITIEQLKTAIEDEIYSHWGVDPMYYSGSSDKTESRWAEADARLLEMLHALADNTVCRYAEEKTERIYHGPWQRSWKPWMPEYNDITYWVCRGTPDLAPCPYDGQCSRCERARK